MHRTSIAVLILLSCFTSGPAHAQSAVTRARLDSELAQAIRQGDWPILEDGSTPRSRNPAAYPARASPALVRAAVEAQRLSALQGGAAPLLDDGTAPRDRAPQAFPQAAAPAPQQRGEVWAELAAATARGELPVLDDGRRPRDLAPMAWQEHAGARTGLASDAATRAATPSQALRPQALPPC